MKRILLAGLILSLPLSSRAGELDDLNYDMPLRIEDSDPTENGNWNFQASSRYEKKRDGDHGLRLDPEIRYGFAERFHAAVSSVTYLGSADRKNSGDAEFEIQTRFTDPKKWLGMGASASVTSPSGKESEGLDTELKLQIEQKIFNGETRILWNGSWFRNAAPGAGESRNTYASVLAVAHEACDTWLVVLEGFREGKREKDEFENGIEIGFRHALSKPWIVAFGAGAGIGPISPDFAGTLGLQYSILVDEN
jgi:hypothetical protein